MHRFFALSVCLLAAVAHCSAQTRSQEFDVARPAFTASQSPGVAPEAPDDAAGHAPDANDANRERRGGEPQFDLRPAPAVGREHAGKDSADEDGAAQEPPANKGGEGFRWRPAIGQSLLFLGVQHGYAFTQPKTRRDLKGEFFRDYVESVRSLHGWDDGGRFFTNYIAHPMEGSLTGFIYVQNSPRATRAKFGKSGDYWKTRLTAMAWSAAWSTQFEIGPVSQASIGNVGLHGKQTYVDLVITPTVGTGLLITEDALDRYVIERIERRFGNFYVRTSARLLLNPTRSLANLLRFEKPWHRDRPLAR